MTTKILLLLIALGLWFNALNPWVLPQLHLPKTIHKSSGR